VKIEGLEIVPYALRFREPYVTARGRLERRELALVRLHAEGFVGLGEVAPLALRGGAGLAEILLELDRFARAALEGADLDPERPYELLNVCEECGVTLGRCAIELGLLDLAAKQRGEPVWRLLGAKRSDRVPCNATLVAGQPAAVAESALRWAELGFGTFKLKVGVEGDVEQVQAVRDAVGTEAHLRVDANGVWNREQAIAKLRALEPFELELAEQPAPTLEDLAAVRTKARVPIAADESVADLGEAQAAADAQACDYVTVKIAKVGGIDRARAIASVLPTYLSSALDGPVGIAAAAHLAQVLPREGLAHGLATAELFADRITTAECEVLNAALTPSDAPGLGVEIDERALERARI